MSSRLHKEFVLGVSIGTMRKPVYFHHGLRTVTVSTGESSSPCLFDIGLEAGWNKWDFGTSGSAFLTTGELLLGFLLNRGNRRERLCGRSHLQVSFGILIKRHRIIRSGAIKGLGMSKKITLVGGRPSFIQERILNQMIRHRGVSEWQRLIRSFAVEQELADLALHVLHIQDGSCSESWGHPRLQ